MTSGLALNPDSAGSCEERLPHSLHRESCRRFGWLSHKDEVTNFPLDDEVVIIVTVLRATFVVDHNKNSNFCDGLR